MTPQTTFVNGVNPWKANPTHRPRLVVIEPKPEPVAVVAKHIKTPLYGRRVAVLAHIRKAGSASISELALLLDMEKYVARRALAALLKECKVRRKTEPSTGATPQYRYFPL